MSLDFCLINEEGDEVFSANITHNLGNMAQEAGIYMLLWRPEELGLTRAQEIAPELFRGYVNLVLLPEHYKQFNSPNGWGMYENFVKFVNKCLTACDEYPTAFIEVSR